YIFFFSSRRRHTRFSRDWSSDVCSSDLNAEETIENTELGDAIYDCLSKLPEKQAQVFKMKTIEGLETDYICNELNITASNLWVIIHRARGAMADCMEKTWF